MTLCRTTSTHVCCQCECEERDDADHLHDRSARFSPRLVPVSEWRTFRKKRNQAAAPLLPLFAPRLFALAFALADAFAAVGPAVSSSLRFSVNDDMPTEMMLRVSVQCP